eukprot:1172437-Prorocentrum_minimum.AAC.1
MAGVEAVFRPSARGAEQLVRGLPGAPGSIAGGATDTNAWATQLQKQHNATLKAVQSAVQAQAANSGGTGNSAEYVR